MSSLDVCNAAVDVINYYVIDDGMDPDGVNEVGAYLLDPENPSAGYHVEVFYGDENASYPPLCAPVISERLARAGLEDVEVVYMLAAPAEVQ